MASRPLQEFAALLRRRRLLAGLSQEALAERAGLSVRGISDLERGVRRAPHPATIYRLAEALDLDDAAREALLQTATPAPVEPPRPVAVAAAPDQASDAVATDAPPLMPDARAPERRWVTLVAVQLGGFAALAQWLDPEDSHALADRCAERVSDEIRRLDGTVLRSDGESILAVFGAPIAHEDDAERALRAGLAIRDCPLPLQREAQGAQVRVRVGIETGEVLAGLQGSGAHRHYAVSGAPVSVAVGLAGGSAASAVLVGEQTYRATSRHVRYRALPPILAPDWARPLSAWEVLGIAPAPHPRALGHAPFVGRDHELDVLLGALARVLREGRPHLVSVLGEPGIGKSRLIAELERRAPASADVRWLHGRCLPYGEVVGYRALAMALYELAGITPDDAAEAARARLRQLVSSALGSPTADPTVRDIERHLALLSGLDTEADRLGNPTDERTMHVAVRRFLEASARARPMCLLIEDLHWGDEALLNLLEHVAERALAAPLLIVTHARPELLEKRPTWGGGIRAFTSLSLEPMDREAGLVLAAALCRERGLSAENAEPISRLAGGNPLFAEELCAAMAEGRGADGVPSALRALISARLDALPAGEKRVLQHAAVLGKRVWPAGLAALDVSGDLFEQLEALERRDLLRSHPRSRPGGQREYAFKHDLIQEMAYGLLPRSERRRLHARLVEWLEETAGERIEEVLDLLAHHAVSAELHERALDYLARAAERAGRAAAHREEAALLGQAIAIAERCGRTDLIPEFRGRRGRAFTRLTLWADARRELEAALAGLPADRRERRAEVLVDLALACNWTLDTPALHRRAGEALAVASTVGRTDLAMDARFWLAWATGSDGDVGSAIEQYRDAVVQTNELGVALAPSVLPLYSTTLCWAGQYPIAVERGREAVRIARAAGDTDSTILALQVLGLALAGTGAYDEAWRVFDEAARFGREYGIERFLARSLAMSAGFHLDVFDYEGHAAVAEEACELARSVTFPPPLISASIDLLVNLARRGEVGRAERLERDVAGAIERAAAWHGWLWNLRYAQARAELALARADVEAALALSDAALRQARGRRPKYEALALVTRAAALVEVGRTTAAIKDLGEAVRVARSIADPALFLRGASALLAIEADDALATEARATARHILGRLPTHEMRQRFQSADPVRRLMSSRDE
jgi:class 3 adenylate cyclase/tetratricopeptide (TPR) repeat protein